MDDQRMLELAAKAAGMIGGYAEHFGEVGIARSHTGIWNPLTDDADASGHGPIIQMNPPQTIRFDYSTTSATKDHK